MDNWTDTRRLPSWRPVVSDDAIRELARLAGIATDWIDAANKPRQVAIGPLRAILEALGYSCSGAADLAASRARLTGASASTRPLQTAFVDVPILLTGHDLARECAGE